MLVRTVHQLGVVLCHGGGAGAGSGEWPSVILTACRVGFAKTGTDWPASVQTPVGVDPRMSTA